MSSIRFMLLLLLFIVFGFALLPALSYAATYTVTSGSCTGPGSIDEAVTLANTNPGADTIELDVPVIDLDGCQRLPLNPVNPGNETYNFLIVDALTVRSSFGQTLLTASEAKEVTQSGSIVSAEANRAACNQAGNILVTQPAWVFGIPDSAPSTVPLTLDRVSISGSAGVVKSKSVGTTSDIAIANGKFSNLMNNALSDCTGGGIEIQRGDIFLDHTDWVSVGPGGQFLPTLPGLLNERALFAIGTDGSMTVRRSTVSKTGSSDGDGVFLLNGGGSVVIESSIFIDAGLIAFDNDTQIVNSLMMNRFLPSPQVSVLLSSFGTSRFNVVASTISAVTIVNGPSPLEQGMVSINVGAGSRVNFNTSLINQQFSSDPAVILNDGFGSGVLPAGQATADSFTYITPSVGQPKSELEKITGQPALLTGDSVLSLSAAFAFDSGLAADALPSSTPVVGSIIIDSIPDATCSGVNALISPIDGSCITTDVFGNPRFDSSTGTRTTGAVEPLNMPAPSTVTLGGVVTGLVPGEFVVLQNNGGDNLNVLADGSFTFPTALASGAAYAVTVLIQPGPISETCTVTNGSGTVANADITNVIVTCTVDNFTVGGTVSGLASGQSVELLNLSGDAQRLSANGSFTFSPQADGTAYAVTVGTQPSGQSCSVSNGSGTLPGGSNVTNVSVTCVDAPHQVGGFVTGLVPGEFVILQNNGGDDLIVSADGSFTFPTPLTSGTAYAVTVLTQVGPISETCTVNNGSGTVVSSDISNVSVTCIKLSRPFPVPATTRPFLAMIFLGALVLAWRRLSNLSV